MSQNILTVSNLSKSYFLNNSELKVLDSVSFTIKESESIAITGPSGSGKSTLMGLCAGLDNPDTGEIHLCGQNISKMNEDQRASLRLSHSSFIFQSFHLMPTLTALENVMVPLELQGNANKETRELTLELLDQVGLKDRHHHFPSQLSGGEQQRVAIARAFINRPKILFADEPTGNLDTHTANNIQSLLFELNQKLSTSLIIVTHDNELAAKADRTLKMKAGKIAE
ncbi:ABC transporter, ATP-binding protein [Lentisphaera araneosa HTCC2155]|uniref:ABC transporter, ATP-binding protein n=1 Tax=Lentisphaera araneosa HTCC2155 TaxID=313628 RepID=A6DU85_9BACT|nr:ABC transporter ATP-binding protein [Lentisphaera araneosa]EDM24796.1 ABC transporter, ATP-binding protein [Lentisphaera araneosa HTCC2155]